MLGERSAGSAALRGGGEAFPYNARTYAVFSLRRVCWRLQDLAPGEGDITVTAPHSKYSLSPALRSFAMCMCHAVIACQGFAENPDVYDSMLRTHDNRINHNTQGNVSRCDEVRVFGLQNATRNPCECMAQPKPGHHEAFCCAIISLLPCCLTRSLWFGSKLRLLLTHFIDSFCESA